MTPEGLESMVAALLRRDGCAYADRVGGRGDEGIDVVGRTADGRSVLVQCKHYRAQKVSPREVREFAGAAAAYPGALRLFVTTNEYTRDAARWAAEKGEVIAIDIVHLLRWASRIWSPMNS
ncbi:restriction endonuclease [Streptomyces sp. NPDC001093]|uniref:restriction endonuclease n=1 Tax=Streptomyces sp. NPDC001093 TaxID=3154376 RepID=UPI0033320B54